jgi:hypothetical protein
LVKRTTIAGETEELGENLPQRHFFPPQIPNDQVQFRAPDRSGGKPATNRLSYGAAFLEQVTSLWQNPLYWRTSVFIHGFLLLDRLPTVANVFCLHDT